MDIFIIQYRYQSRFLNVINGDVYVHKYEKCKFDQPFLFFQPKHIFIGNSKVCKLTEFSGDNDSSDFDGNTILLECEDKEYVYIAQLEISKFKTDDKIIDYISLMGINMCPYTFAIGENYTYFKSTHYKFIGSDEIEEGFLLNARNISLDPFDYHLGKCGLDSFKTLEQTQKHTCWLGFEEDEEDEDDVLVDETGDMIETKYFNGNKEVVKILIESVLYITKEIMFMLLDNVVVSLIASNVIKIKVILMYWNLLFVEHNITIETKVKTKRKN